MSDGLPAMSKWGFLYRNLRADMGMSEVVSLLEAHHDMLLGLNAGGVPVTGSYDNAGRPTLTLPAYPAADGTVLFDTHIPPTVTGVDGDACLAFDSTNSAVKWYKHISGAWVLEGTYGGDGTYIQLVVSGTTATITHIGPGSASGGAVGDGTHVCAVTKDGKGHAVTLTPVAIDFPASYTPPAGTEGALFVWQSGAWKPLALSGSPGDVLEHNGATPAEPAWTTPAWIPKPAGAANGDMLYFNGTNWVLLVYGSSDGKVITGAGGIPTWATAPAGDGTVLYLDVNPTTEGKTGDSAINSGATSGYKGSVWSKATGSWVQKGWLIPGTTATAGMLPYFDGTGVAQLAISATVGQSLVVASTGVLGYETRIKPTTTPTIVDGHLVLWDGAGGDKVKDGGAPPYVPAMLYGATDPPASGTGNVGDTYTVTGSGKQYQKTGASTWTLEFTPAVLGVDTSTTISYVKDIRISGGYLQRLLVVGQVTLVSGKVTISEQSSSWVDMGAAAIAVAAC